ncbi:MAG TPA: hypothetical protein VNU92_02335 [Edaphobacter sp.]|jgi:hypothetical protein|nr:hypothetical protein [Edaphobacter sp.]
MLRRLPFVIVILALALPLCAQANDSALSEREIEQLRESAYIPNDRIILFIKLLDTRDKAIQELYAHPRKPGREQDTHDLMAQFTSIADELNDNLDDYGPHHRDIRKSLPKLLDATERWSSNLKQPPENSSYDLARKLALEAIRDIREEASKLIDDQKAWFAAHPPPKEPDNVPAREVPRQPQMN